MRVSRLFCEPIDSLECFFGWRRTDGEYVGGNHSVLVEGVQVRAGLLLMQPPYPRPEFYGPERLDDLLGDWTKLRQVLRNVAVHVFMTIQL